MAMNLGTHNARLRDKRSHHSRIARGFIPYGQALRPRQWTKNLIVFSGPFFAIQHTLFELRNGFYAFGLFSALASSFYLLNDILDVEADRKHPIKCQQPIAAGLVQVPWAMEHGGVIQ